MAPGRFQIYLRKEIVQLILVIDGWSISCKIVLKWMPMHLTDGKSTLVQVMAWCRQATSHYLSQCWPRILSPYDVIRPQCSHCCSADLGVAYTHQHMLTPPCGTVVHNTVRLDPLLHYGLNTVRCCYNTLKFQQNPKKRHPIARPWRRDILYFIILISDSLSATVIAVLYIKSW